jgi:hypothetical protein
MTAYIVIAGIVAAALLALTVLNQFGQSRWNVLRGRDTMNLIPVWTFFAPRPGQTDYHLLFRTRTADRACGEWIEIPLAEDRKPWSWLWNPEKRAKKVLSDIVASALESGMHRCTDDTKYLLTMPYLLMLRVVCSCATESGHGRDVQFVLAETAAHLTRSEQGAGLLLVSRWHRLPDRGSESVRAVALTA